MFEQFACLSTFCEEFQATVLLIDSIQAIINDISLMVTISKYFVNGLQLSPAIVEPPDEYTSRCATAQFNCYRYQTSLKPSLACPEGFREKKSDFV